MQDAALSLNPAVSTRRWIQLLLGFIVMMAISSPQYVWTLFVKSFQTTTGGSLAAVQITFSILVVLQTWLSPLQGWLIDRFGPKLLITFGAALSGLGWVAAANVTNIYALYATYGLLCGLGTGFVYVGVVGLMVRWFPERRGFAAGVAAAGYGFGAMLTTFPITDMMAKAGYQHTLFVFGLILGSVGVLASIFLRNPHPDELPAGAVKATSGVAPGRHARLTDLLADVRHDDDDVDRRPDGGVAIRRLRERVQSRRCAGLRPRRSAAAL